MTPVLLLLGSNIEPERHIPQARGQLTALLHHCRFSSTYLTEPVGDAHQPPFWNQAATGSTQLPLDILQQALADLEAAHQRQRDPSRPCGPRTLDLDILLYGELVGRFGSLVLPSPLLQREAFVLVPAAEVAPHWRHPVLGKTLSELAAALPRRGVHRLEEGAHA